MQLIPRYLVSNRTTIIANEAGFVTEYRPVYQKHIQVYKGIDNVLQFRVLNADQKPVDISSYTPHFQAFDSEARMVIDRQGTAVTGDDSAAIRGLFSVNVTANDLLNVKQQYLSYSIHLDDANNISTITYADSHFGNSGTIFVSSEAFPGPLDNYSVTTFNAESGVWNSESITAQPGINGNDALHTVAVYTTSYVGTLTIQATLDNEVSTSTDWADITSITFDGSETEPTPVNFNGVYSFLRFVANADPADKISKILVRN